MNLGNTSLIYNSLYVIHSTLLGRLQLQHKKDKDPTCLVPIVFGVLKTRLENQPVATIKILLDSGASSTLIRENWAKNLSTIPSNPTNWTTTAGTFKTTEQVQVQLILPELHEGKTICCNAHVANTLGIYDLIIGRDLLIELGFMLNFKMQTVEWDEIEIPMKPENATPEWSFHIKDSDAMDSATERIKGILEAKYEAADLNKLAMDCDHLLVQQQQQLKQLFHKFDDLFDGTLGTWKGDPYNIELKADATPYHARAYPIPKIHEETL